MDGSDVQDALEAAEQAFERATDTVEPGLDVDDDALVQLRKGCRLLTAARTMREQDAHTVVVETSFGSIERLLHFYLLRRAGLDVSEYLNHEMVYERAAEANLYSNELRDKFLQLWRENRSRTYYRQFVSGERHADAMLALAETVHDHVLGLTGATHECGCD